MKSVDESPLSVDNPIDTRSIEQHGLVGYLPTVAHEGAVVGAVAGYVGALFLRSGDGGARDAALALVFLPACAFCACLFRGGEAGYSAIVCSWTAVIVATAGTGARDAVATAALERVTHSVIGVSALVLCVGAVFPSWARDAARAHCVALLSECEDIHASTWRQWLRVSSKNVMSTRTRGGAAGSPHGGDSDDIAPLLRQLELSVDNDDDDDGARLPAPSARAARGRVTALSNLVDEACVEPALWRAPLDATRERALVWSIDELLLWLAISEAHLLLLDDTSALARALSAACLHARRGDGDGDASPARALTRWLSRDWVSSLRGASDAIGAHLAGLRAALAADGSDAGEALRAAWRVESCALELRRELDELLRRCDAGPSSSVRRGYCRCKGAAAAARPCLLPS